MAEPKYPTKEDMSAQRALMAEQWNIPDAECAKCGKSVLVRDGEDWEEGDLCDHCNGDRVKELEAEVAQLKIERDEYQAKSYGNMCRDQHMQIGFEGEDFQPCPVCQLQAEVAQLKLFLMDCPQCAKKESDNAALRARCERLEKPVSDVQHYFYSILVAEGLEDWKIKIAADPHCWIEMKTIQLPDDASMGLFLHEVAHALYPEPEGEKKNHYHGGKWASIYGTLIDKYMRFNDSLDR